ncbi:PucC family protein [Jannaschia seohaensis]|uniref:BCD family chlorophyll transporter-like MFS transporter n=1 Tax=Jannaschia seohaensis TaxID=475081 RepID=A0A2Y9A0A4_9RHOB|nr:PucC family protein [Jannaschia seohaensis]PWJ21703.1 BCD family chlorophyll transporter-like MFS transporter [Jannaschia seohaensis]SSA37981.1 MFS transporter, BCD family, chlorophyll transporter [Jannaschia seohaensis]
MSGFRHIALKALPFSDAGSAGLPLPQLLRLSLFQISVGMAAVMLLGTLNRVMIVELGLSAFLVAAMIALPVLVAPFRALLGFKSDTYRSAIGWKRIPYLWFGTLWQFGGLAIMPFALLILGGYDQTYVPPFAGEFAAACAFVMTGLGMHMTQTAGLALAADRADDETRPRVVALLYVAFLLGMLISAIIIGWLLRDFDGVKLIQVVQGTAVVTLALNVVALWKQESLRPTTKEERAAPPPAFKDAWADLTRGGTAGRLLAAVFLGTMAFNMQDVLLEPYGGEILGLSVSKTTLLTATWAIGAIGAFFLAAKWLTEGINTTRMAGRGVLVGIGAFCAVIFAAPLDSAPLFFTGSLGIGFGGGLFAVATLTTAMTLPVTDLAGRGLALGAWGAAQATAQGLSTALGGGIRDGVDALASTGVLGEALAAPTTGYSVVYHLEIGLLFLTLVALGPLVRRTEQTDRPDQKEARIGLADFPT